MGSATTPSRTVNNLIRLLTPDKAAAPFTPTRAAMSASPPRMMKRSLLSTPVQATDENSPMTATRLESTPKFVQHGDCLSVSQQFAATSRSVKRQKINSSPVLHDQKRSTAKLSVNLSDLIDAWMSHTGENSNDDVINVLMKLRSNDSASVVSYASLTCKLIDRIENSLSSVKTTKSPHKSPLRITSLAVGGKDIIQKTPLLKCLLSYLVSALCYIRCHIDNQSASTLHAIGGPSSRILSLIIDLSTAYGREKSAETNNFIFQMASNFLNMLTSLASSSTSSNSIVFISSAHLVMKYLTHNRVLRSITDDEMISFVFELLTCINSVQPVANTDDSLANVSLSVIYEVTKGWYEAFSEHGITYRPMTPLLRLFNTTLITFQKVKGDEITDASISRLSKVLGWMLKQVTKYVPNSNASVSVNEAIGVLESPNIKLLIELCDLLWPMCQSTDPSIIKAIQDMVLYSISALVYVSLLTNNMSDGSIINELSYSLSGILLPCGRLYQLDNMHELSAIDMVDAIVILYNTITVQDDKPLHSTIESILQIVQISRHALSILRESLSASTCTPSAREPIDELISYNIEIVSSLVALSWDPDNEDSENTGSPLPVMSLGTPKKLFQVDPKSQTTVNSRCTTPFRISRTMSPSSAKTRSPARFLTPKIRAIHRCSAKRSQSIVAADDGYSAGHTLMVDEPFHLTYAFGMVTEEVLWRSLWLSADDTLEAPTLNHFARLIGKSHCIIIDWLKGLLEGIVWGLCLSTCDCPNSAVFRTLIDMSSHTNDAESMCPHIFQSITSVEGSSIHPSPAKEFLQTFRTQFNSRCMRLCLSLLETDIPMPDTGSKVDTNDSGDVVPTVMSLISQCLVLWRSRRDSRCCLHRPSLARPLHCPPELSSTVLSEPIKLFWNVQMRPLYSLEDHSTFLFGQMDECEEALNMIMDSSLPGVTLMLSLFFALSSRTGYPSMNMYFRSEVENVLPAFCRPILEEDRQILRNRMRHIELRVLPEMKDLSSSHLIQLLMSPYIDRYDNKALYALSGLNQWSLLKRALDSVVSLFRCAIDSIACPINVNDLKQWAGEYLFRQCIDIRCIGNFRYVCEFLCGGMSSDETDHYQSEDSFSENSFTWPWVSNDGYAWKILSSVLNLSCDEM
eukprot:GHVH01008001.1.p1 GENE.GHVH01008001.1~~GHVH01008001.1.p1  ORF type:complete len:1139 (-),score=143.48 GHVH01008001.1:2245-5661(-)